MVFRVGLNLRIILTWSLRVHCSVQMSVMRLRACLAISSRNMLHRDRLRSPIWCLCVRGKTKQNREQKCFQRTKLHSQLSVPIILDPPSYTPPFSPACKDYWEFNSLSPRSTRKHSINNLIYNRNERVTFLPSSSTCCL